jgi:Protein of unknown function (DUF3592)
MSKSNEVSTRSKSERAFIALFLAVFMAAFATVAFIFGALPIADAVVTVWRGSSLVEVAATIREVRLERDSRRAKEHLKSLSARYSYQWNGATYESSRISVQHWAGWSDGATWHQEWFDRLDAARRSGATVSAWVNPSNPKQAVLDKELRWARLFLAIPLLILFGAVSLFAAMQLVRVLLGIDRK